MTDAADDVRRSRRRAPRQRKRVSMTTGRPRKTRPATSESWSTRRCRRSPSSVACSRTAGTDLADVVDRAGISVYDLAQEVDNGADMHGRASPPDGVIGPYGAITDDEVRALKERDRAVLPTKRADAARRAEAVNVDLEEANAILKEQDFNDEPARALHRSVGTPHVDLRDGKVDSRAAAEADQRPRRSRSACPLTKSSNSLRARSTTPTATNEAVNAPPATTPTT